MRHFTLLLAFLSLILSVFCSSPPSFCKCTCFTNSTIIELNPPASSPELLIRSTHPSILEKRAPSAACTRCNRAFCIAQNLPICKNAEEKDIFTTCFQRDSRKDQIFVIGFMCTTVGLLGWAVGKEILERGKRRKATAAGAGQGTYAPVR